MSQQPPAQVPLAPTFQQPPADGPEPLPEPSRRNDPATRVLKFVG